MKCFLFLCLLFSFHIVSGQQSFIKSFGRDSLNINPRGVCAGLNGSYFLYGTLEIPTNSIYVIKFNSQNDTLWSVIVDSLQSDTYYYVNSNVVVATNDGGCAITGIIHYADVGFVKIDSTGSVSFRKNFGASSIESISRVLQTRDSGYVILAIDKSIGNPTFEFLQIWKLNSNGDTLWTKVSQQNINEGDIYEAPNGDLYQLEKDLVGGLVKMNNSGDEIWRVNFRITLYPKEFIAITDTKIVLKVVNMYLVDTVKVLILDTSGVFLDGVSIVHEEITDGKILSDGNLMLTVTRADTLSILKFDSSLTPLFCRRFFHLGAAHFYPASDLSKFIELPDKSILLNGKYEDSTLTYSTGFILKVDSLGKSSCKGDSGMVNTIASSESITMRSPIINPHDYSLYPPFYIPNNSIQRGFQFLPLCISTEITDADQTNRYTIFPNPTTGSIQIHGEDSPSIDIGIYDLTGRLLFYEANLTFPKQLELGYYGRGFYLVRFFNKDGVSCCKVIVE